MRQSAASTDAGRRGTKLIPVQDKEVQKQYRCEVYGMAGERTSSEDAGKAPGVERRHAQGGTLWIGVVPDVRVPVIHPVAHIVGRVEEIRCC